jgi:hypothetical protein
MQNGIGVMKTQAPPLKKLLAMQDVQIVAVEYMEQFWMAGRGF